MPLSIIFSKPAGLHDITPFFPASASTEERRADEGEERGHEAVDPDEADGDRDGAGEGDD